jgi:hypothetical protein
VTQPIRHFVGVYDADGGLIGELRYVIGHLRGTTSCSLCDITHTAIRKKPAFTQAVAQLDVPFVLKHRNELTVNEKAAIGADGLPAVLAAHDDGSFTVVLTPDMLAACNGDIQQLIRQLPAI